MSHEINVQAQPRAWLMHSILRPHVPRYAEHLHRGRYAANTRRAYLCCVAHFAHWLTEEGHTLDAVNEAGIARFISEHLPRCKCPYPVRRCVYEIRAAVARLLEALRADGVISGDLAVEDHIGRELVQFDAYMRDVGGLAANTRQQRQRVVGRFLAEQSGSGPIIAIAITPKAVRRFVLGEKQGWSAGTIRVIGGAIGCLRFIVEHSEATRAVALGVEEFIDEGLDQFWNLLNELESIDDVTQRRPRLGQFAAQLSALADDISGMGDADREILRQLRSGIADMQIQVLNSLHRTTHPVVLPYVRTLALGASDENARIAAIDALADARGTDAAEVFAAIACKPGSLPVRAEATLALQALGTGAGASALKRTEDTLASDPVLSPLLRRHGSEIVIP